MSKRVQYAQSLPVLTSAPPQEADRAVVYARSAGLHYRKADGTEVGPLAPQNVFVQASKPAVAGPYVWWQTLPGGDLTLWVEDGA